MSKYEEKGRVSVWLGSFPDKTSFEVYLKETYNEDGDASCPFWTDLGLTRLDHDFQEATHRAEGSVPLDQFFSGNSCIASFLEPLKAACARLGMTSAKSKVLVYDLAYPADRPFPCPHLRFIGSFPYASE